MLSIGDHVHNYRIEEQLQNKSLVETYLVVCSEDGKKYILKQLKSDFRKESRLYKSFLGAYLQAKGVQHDHLLPIKKVLREEIAIVFPYLEGISLRTWMDTKGKIEPLQALRWGAQVLSALNVLHQRRMVHLEVCPENIFVVRSNREHHVVLMDRGIAHRIDASVQPEIPPHRRYYWSPELIANPSSAKFRSDIYSLGVVLFEMMSGRKMIVGDRPEEIVSAIVKGEREAVKAAAPHVPASIALVIEQSLQVNPISRYPTANAFLDALVRAVGGPLLDDDQATASPSELDDLFIDFDDGSEDPQEEVEEDSNPPQKSASKKNASQARTSSHSKQGGTRENTSQPTDRHTERDRTKKSTKREKSSEEDPDPENKEKEASPLGTIVVDQNEQVDVEVLEGNAAYNIDGKVITLEHSADQWTEARLIAESTPKWRQILSPRVMIVAAIVILLFSMVGGYKASSRSFRIVFADKPEWGEMKFHWDGKEQLLLNFDAVATGVHILDVEGGIYEGGECVRCCWQRKFDVSIPMGFEQEERTLSLLEDEKKPMCPTIEAKYNFSLIDAGHFDMGSSVEEASRGDDELYHRVVLTQPVMVGTTEVTQLLYKMVMESNPARFQNQLRPIESVSWVDAVYFCNRLSEIESLTPCYEIDGRYIGWKAGLACDGYRLPTEAEWEYSARAGQNTTYAGSNDPNDMWYGKSSNGESHLVAQKPANAKQLFDMSGNVAEWVWDYYGEYSAEDFRDPKGPNTGVYRVFRGGDWMHIAHSSRVASRDEAAPARRSPYIGFRIVQSYRKK